MTRPTPVIQNINEILHVVGLAAFRKTRIAVTAALNDASQLRLVIEDDYQTVLTPKLGNQTEALEFFARGPERERRNY